MNAGLAMIRQMMDRLSPSEKRIAEYILRHPSESVNLTTHELGERSGTSGATVIRLCKSLNLNGFQDLKLRIVGDLQQSDRSEVRDIEPGETVSTIIEKVTSHSLQTIQETVNMINHVTLTEAVTALSEAPHLHFFGVGGSSIPAIDAQQKFLRINKPTNAFTDIHMAATGVANASQKDVVFVISFSGETEEVVRLLRVAKSRGAKTISLTSYGQSTVSEMADISLFTSSTKEAAFRSAATSSRLAQLHMIDILFMYVASQDYEQSVKFLDETREAIHMLGKKVSRSERGK